MLDIKSLTEQDLIVLMEQAFSAMDEVCSQVDGDQWDVRTDCPAWTVKDQLSHIAAFESTAVGMPQPETPDVGAMPHVVNETHKMTEVGVEARRPWAPERILEEYREATTARLKQLAELDAAGWEATTKSPVGELPTRRFLPIRILDVFYHEQDVRRAVGAPGHLDGQVAAFVFARMANQGLPYVISHEAKAPDGSVVVFDVGVPGETIAVETREGKGHLVEPPAEPTVRISTDYEVFFCLLGGRRAPQHWIDAGRVRIEGDQELGKRILDNMVVVP